MTHVSRDLWRIPPARLAPGTGPECPPARSCSSLGPIRIHRPPRASDERSEPLHRHLGHSAAPISFGACRHLPVIQPGFDRCSHRRWQRMAPHCTATSPPNPPAPQSLAFFPRQGEMHQAIHSGFDTCCGPQRRRTSSCRASLVLPKCQACIAVLCSIRILCVYSLVNECSSPPRPKTARSWRAWSLLLRPLLETVIQEEPAQMNRKLLATAVAGAQLLRWRLRRWISAYRGT